MLRSVLFLATTALFMFKQPVGRARIDGLRRGAIACSSSSLTYVSQSLILDPGHYAGLPGGAVPWGASHSHGGNGRGRIAEAENPVLGQLTRVES